ncbi:hypothetical protein F4803DRAFT_559977 [Xylaria telfairii]|nr:hypothetical protein F4803DRAFT_559977 [Xylaria telfairii]
MSPFVSPNTCSPAILDDEKHGASTDQEVCITCHTLCQNKTALRKHGANEDHHPYGCVCGSTFARLDVLERHIASKNKVTKYQCPLCEHGTAKTFARADHLPQHLRTFHKIPAGKIPEHFMLSDGAADEPIPPPRSMPSFPCSMPGCTKIGELAYLRQIDLDEHMLSTHCAIQNNMAVHQEPNNPLPTWTDNNFQPNVHLHPAMTFRQDAQPNGFWQPDLAGTHQVDEQLMGSDTFGDFLMGDGFGFGFGV